MREKPPIRAVVSFGLLALLVSVGIWWSDGLASLADADTNPTTDSNPLARRTHEVRPEEGLRSEGRLASNSTGISNFDRRPALDNPKEEDPRVLALTGQVVDVSLRPVRGAAIRWLDSPNEKQRILGRTDAEGFFAVPRPSTDGLRLRIIEQSTGLQEVHVPRGELETPYDLGRIVLRAQGVIAGQVVFPNGKPVREFPVQLRHVNEDDKDDPPGAFLWTQHTVTDDRGAFRFATLQHRRYVVYLPEADSLEERERLERSEPIERCFAVGTTEIRLTTAIQRLRVRILDNEGRSSTWEELKITHFHSENLPQTQRMLEAGKDPMEIDGEVLPGVYGANPGHGAWETLYRFPVLVEFRARTSKHDWSEPWRRRFERPAAPFEKDVVLRSGPRIEWREHVLVLRDELGRPLPGPLPSSGRDASSNAHASHGGSSLRPYRVAVLLDAKPYDHGLVERFQVEGQHHRGIRLISGSYSLSVMILPKGLQAEADLLVENYLDEAFRIEETTPKKIPITFTTRGRIELLLHGSQVPKDTPLAGTITLVDSRGRQVRPEQAWPMLQGEAQAPVSKLLPGTVLRLQPRLEPGNWSVLVRVPGHEPIETQLDVSKGRCRRAELRLTQR